MSRSFITVFTAIAAWISFWFIPLVTGQQVYVSVPEFNGSSTSGTRKPSASTTFTSPSYYFTPFSFTQTETLRVASSNPATSHTTYAVPYSSIQTMFAHVSSTTWPNWTPVLFPQATATSSAYDAAAYSQLWIAANVANFSRGLYSTTVSPTPVPTSELIFPPPLLYSPDNNYKFPADFVYGAAGSASQCEGAVADEGKSPALTDMFAQLLVFLQSIGTSNPVSGLGGGTSSGPIVNNFVTQEHYYLYKQDIERMAAIGLKHYSFSIPWTRIMPFALPGTPVNSQALAHYGDVIDFVIEKGMQPIVTLHHFDTPLVFLGGGQDYIFQLAANRAYWGLGLNVGFNNATFEDAFVNYAQIVMAHYADRVPIWITINEPQVGAINGPAVNTVIKSHARIVHFYREKLHGKGKVSMKSAISPAVPFRPHHAGDVNSALFYNDLYIGALLNPLALGKDYPPAFKNAIQDYVPLSEEDLSYLNDTLDFVAIDAYEAPIIKSIVSDLNSCARDNSTANENYAFPICVGTSVLTQTGWETGYSPSGAGSFAIAPSYLRTQLNYMWNTYRKPVVVSEFGLELALPPNVTGSLPTNLFNTIQSEYTLSFLSEMLKAIWEDGVHIMGAITWNWADDWEFGNFDTGFGLQYVNRTSQQRIYRRSFFDVIDFIGSRMMTE